MPEAGFYGFPAPRRAGAWAGRGAGHPYAGTDAPYLALDRRAVLGPIGVLTPPQWDAGANWSWVNQSTAALALAGEAWQFTIPTVSGDNCRIYVRSIPSTPYTATLAWVGALSSGNAAIGAAWRESGSGKLVLSGAIGSTGAVNTATWNSPTSWVTNVASPTYHFGAVLWLRLVDDGTNRTVSWSPDGLQWLQMYSATRTTFITPDQIGIYLNSSNNATSGMLVHWSIG